MGFLDRMVSDLIRDNTGINARRLVRRIGGGKLLALGGAALAATMMGEKKGAFGQAAAGQPAPGRPPAAPPPVPGAGPPPVPETTPPPIPTEAGEAGEADDELPPELTYPVVRTMVAAALADGHLADQEKAIIHRHLGESGLSFEQTQQVHKDLVLPPSVDELAALAPAVEAREVLYRFAALVVLADDESSDLERRWLDRLAAAFGLGAERATELETELFAKGDE